MSQAIQCNAIRELLGHAARELGCDVTWTCQIRKGGRKPMVQWTFRPKAALLDEGEKQNSAD